MEEAAKGVPGHIFSSPIRNGGEVLGLVLFPPAFNSSVHPTLLCCSVLAHFSLVSLPLHF